MKKTIKLKKDLPFANKGEKLYLIEENNKFFIEKDDNKLQIPNDKLSEWIEHSLKDSSLFVGEIFYTIFTKLWHIRNTDYKIGVPYKAELIDVPFDRNHSPTYKILEGKNKGNLEKLSYGQLYLSELNSYYSNIRQNNKKTKIGDIVCDIHSGEPKRINTISFEYSDKPKFRHLSESELKQYYSQMGWEQRFSYFEYNHQLYRYIGDYKIEESENKYFPKLDMFIEGQNLATNKSEKINIKDCQLIHKPINDYIKSKKEYLTIGHIHKEYLNKINL